MTQSIRRLSVVLLSAFGIVALFAGYWSLVRGPNLLAREDNPRRIQAEQQIQRGRILDRNGVALAQTTLIGGIAVREYPFPSAAPVVGYYSVRYGTGGIENQYDALLRGEIAVTVWQKLWDNLLHHDQMGGDVRLTLDAEVQKAAAALLVGRQGAIVVIAAPSGEILAMASAPSYDPNMLEENWDVLREDPGASLLNRATQGLYQPGASLESIILGSAINSGIVELDDASSGKEVEIAEGLLLPCASNNPIIHTIADAYLSACPAPFLEIGETLGLEGLTLTLSDFGLLESLEFAIPVESGTQLFSASNSTGGQIAIGQSDLTITPLHMAGVALAFANHGQIPSLRLVSDTRLPNGSWQPILATGTPRGTISRDNADTIASLMFEAVQKGAAQQADLPSYSVAGHTGLALEGPDGTTNAWFIGFVPLEDDVAYAVAVLLEDTPDGGEAAALGGQVLNAVLNTR